MRRNANGSASTTNYGVSVGSDDSLRAINNHQHYTDYGKRHGGSSKLFSLMLSASGVAFTGVVVLNFVLSTYLHMDGLPALAVIACWLIAFMIFDIVVGFLYLKPRRMFKLLVMATVWVTIGLGITAAIIYGLIQLQ